jgi:fructan beta-fructosidase
MLVPRIAVTACLRAGAALTAVVILSCALASPEETTGNEPLRPQIHFSPARHWMNDPNGLVYFDGEYHLFFQYNPQGEKWGHMSWGHAVSTDLVHWRELPIAIPEDDRYMIFSGSVVVDAHNSSGFARDGQPVLVAVYTGAEQGDHGRQNQQLAYSTDKGRSWTKYRDNPVLDLELSSFRDPKVFWYEPDHVWIMAAVLSDQHQVALFSSPDLKNWTHLSDFGPAGAADGAWECPDLFALSIDGDRAKVRWMLKVDVFKSKIARGAGAQYFTGHFDGRTFIADGDPANPTAGPLAQWIDYGMDFYAAASWSNLPDPGRHVWIAWMNNHSYAQQTPTSRWRGAMSLPRELSLHDEDGVLTLEQNPVAELQALRARHQTVTARELGPDPFRLNLPSLGHGAVELIADLAAGSAREFGIKVHVGDGQETQIGYNSASRLLFVDRARSGYIPAPIFAQRQSAPLQLEEGRIHLHIFVDASSVEVFGGAGQLVLTDQVFPGPRSEGIEFYADGGHARLENLQLWTLKSTRLHVVKSAGELR